MPGSTSENEEIPERCHAYYQTLGHRPETHDLSADFDLSLYERNTIDADQALSALGEIGSGTQTYLARGVGGAFFSRYVLEGLVARIKGDAAAAQQAFEAARPLYEKEHRDDPEYGPSLCILGMIDAALGRNQEALQEGQQAVELSPLTKRSLDGADVLYFYAVTCAWTGERDPGNRGATNARENPGRPKLRRPALESELGFSPRRSALRKDRRLPRA